MSDIESAAKRMQQFNSLTQLISSPWDTIDQREKDHWIGLATVALSLAATPTIAGGEDTAWTDWFGRAEPFDGVEEAFRAGYRTSAATPGDRQVALDSEGKPVYFAAAPARDAVIEECAKHIEREADVATNSLHCGDNSQTIAATHRVSRAYHEAAKSIRSLVSRPMRGTP